MGLCGNLALQFVALLKSTEIQRHMYLVTLVPLSEAVLI